MKELTIQGYNHHTQIVQGLSLSYFVSDLTKTNKLLVVLHGWNQGGLESWNSFLERVNIDLDINILAIEMPAFGRSQDPSEVWGAEEYARYIHDFIQDYKEQNGFKQHKVYLAGHSFGGGVATLVTVDNLLSYSGLVLLAPAIIRSQEIHTKKQKLTKFGKVLFNLPILKSIQSSARKVWYKLLGSPDYNQTSGIKREIMKKILRQDLLSAAQKIVIPTLICWGTKDRYTPYIQADILKTTIQDSQLITLDGINHGLHLHAIDEVIEGVKHFITH